MPSGIRSKLTAAVAMLLVSLILLVSSTYAWFTLSTAPEVKNITTTVAGNGSLEIALMPQDGLLGSIKNGLSIFVKDYQFRSWQLLTRNIGLGNLHFRHIILHLDFLCFRRIFYCKSNTLRSHITICRFCLRQSVLLSCNKFFNDMSLFPGSP